MKTELDMDKNPLDNNCTHCFDTMRFQQLLCLETLGSTVILLSLYSEQVIQGGP